MSEPRYPADVAAEIAADEAATADRVAIHREEEFRRQEDERVGQVLGLAPANGHAVFSRDAVAAAQDLQHEWVDVPEWGGGCYARGLTALERSQLERTMIDQQGKPNMTGLDSLRARLVIAGAVDDAGRRIFDNRDLALVQSKFIIPVERIADVVSRLSGMDAATLGTLSGKSDEPIPDGSTTPPSDGSPSASPSPWDMPTST